MQDLLNEQDFITQTPNPWKRFKIFYAINFAVLIAFFTLFKFVFDNEPGEITGILVFIAMPLASAFIMILGNAKNIYLPFRTIVSALFLLVLIYIVTIPLAALLLNRDDFFTAETVEVMLAVVGVYMLLFIVATSIILLIINSKRKKRAKHNNPQSFT